MEMEKRDLRKKAGEAIASLEPQSKMAQLRALMPDIERKVAQGASIPEIHQALVDSGFDLTVKTLRTYLYRYRKKLRGQSVVSPNQTSPHIQHAPQSDPVSEPVGPRSVQDIDRLMRPDPHAQAQELASYERLGRQNRRSSK